MGAINAAALRKEVDVSAFLPYTSLVTPSVVKLGELGAYVFSIELRGVAHASAGAADINHWHYQQNRLTAQIADPRVALHAHTIHDPVAPFPAGEFNNRFARDYNAKYRALMSKKNMHATRHFLSVVYKPQAAAARWLARRRCPSLAALHEQQTEELAAVGDLIHTVLAGLDAFAPKLLLGYQKNGVPYSRTLELYSRILNGRWRPVAVPRADIRAMLPTSRPFFGKGGLLSLKHATGIDYGAILAIKEYPTPTFPGRLDALLEQAYPWVLSQSFTYVSDTVALKLMREQRNRLESVGDEAKSQIKQINDALDDLAAGESALGHHELSLLVSAPDEDMLNARIAAAGTVLGNTGMTWLREDIALGSAFFAMLPGNLGYRVAPQLIDNRNFSGFTSPHAHPAGRLDGAQWGPAVTLFESSAGTPVAFNWHQIDPDPAAKLDPNHKEPATTLVIGPTGGGKTVLLGHLLTQSQKFAAFPAHHPGPKKLSCVVFDKDLGLSIAVPALGGHYTRIQTGMPSGLAPFQLDPSPANLAFLDQLASTLAMSLRPDLPLSLQQHKAITAAVHGVMATPRPLRRLGALLEFFDDTEADGLHARLAPWCAGGQYGWLFDNPADTLETDFPVLGFDVTDFLKTPATCTPLMLYLLHRVDSLLDGRRVPIFIDEAPFLLADPLFRAYIAQALVQIRKKDGFLVLAAQFPRQVLDSPLAAALVSQPATMIFLADPKADMADLVRGFKLSVSEVEIIRHLGKRQALLRQGTTSTVIDLTLTGFEDELAVLSGNTATAALAGRLIAQHGPDPERWLDAFQRQRKGDTTHNSKEP